MVGTNLSVKTAGEECKIDLQIATYRQKRSSFKQETYTLHEAPAVRLERTSSEILIYRKGM